MKRSIIGTWGVAIGMLALAMAFLPPWIADAIAPPQPVEVEVVDFASRLKDAAVAKIKGEQYTPLKERKKDLGDYVPSGIIALGMLGVCLGVTSTIRGERKVYGMTAIGLGVGAAVVQWSIIICSILIFAILVAVVLNMLGIELS